MRLRACLAVAAALLLAGCTSGGSAPEQPAIPSPPQPAPTSVGLPDLQTSPALQRIQQRGRLIVGVRHGDPTSARHDPATGEYEGFDVEVARIVAAGLGLDPRDDVSVKPLQEVTGLNAVATSDIDMQLGVTDGNANGASGIQVTDPYGMVGPPGSQQRRHVAVTGQDAVLRDRIDGILRRAVTDRSWQRAYEATLGADGVPASPPR